MLNWLTQDEDGEVVEPSEVEGGDGFKVGSTVQRCTRGIWVWGRPKMITLQSGERVALLVLDTEGIGGLESDTQYDTRIFALATLLCSTLTYNSLGSIDENAISSLSFIANLTQSIKLRGPSQSTAEEGGPDSPAPDDGADDGGDAIEFHKFFPSFIWVLRDFALDLVDEEGYTISADQYLAHALAPQVGSFEKETLERNNIRRMLMAFFTERHAVPLVRPLHDEEQLQDVTKVALDDLRPEFLTGLADLKELIAATMRPKVMNDRPLSGSMYSALVQSYVDAINSDGVPTISTAWESVSAGECESAHKDALKHYATCLEGAAMPVLEHDVADLHASSLISAFTRFDSRAVGEASKGLREKLGVDCHTMYDAWCEKNIALSTSICQELLESIDKEVLLPLEEDSDKLADGGTTQLELHWTELVRRYKLAAKGPSIDSVLSDYTSLRWKQLTMKFEAAVTSAKEAELAELEKKATAAMASKRYAEAESEAQKKTVEAQVDELNTLRVERAKLQAESKAQQTRMSQFEEDMKAKQKQRSDAQSELEEAHEHESLMKGQLEGKDKEMEALKKANTEMEERIKMLESQPKGCGCVVA